MAHPLLIKAITSMVLISIQPFVLRKIFLVIAALLCFSALCFADPVLMAQRYAPAGAGEGHEFKRVDLPPRNQGFLPGNHPDSGAAPMLVISARLSYT
jgi:hypothetical protein